MKYTYNDLTKVTEMALSLGCTTTKQHGIFLFKGQSVDLTSSGNEKWQVAQNILQQLN